MYFGKLTYEKVSEEIFHIIYFVKISGIYILIIKFTKALHWIRNIRSIHINMLLISKCVYLKSKLTKSFRKLL